MLSRWLTGLCCTMVSGFIMAAPTVEEMRQAPLQALVEKRQAIHQDIPDLFNAQPLFVVKRWDLKDFNITLPDGKEGNGSVGVMSKDQRFYFSRGTRSAAANTKDGRLLANVTWQSSDKQNGYVSFGILELDKKQFLPLFLEGESAGTDPVEGTVYSGDGNAVPALIQDKNGNYQPAICSLDIAAGKSYSGCKALPAYTVNGTKTITVPIEIPARDAPGSIVVGVVLKVDDEGINMNPWMQVYWLAETPYESYSSPMVRKQGPDGSTMYYGGTLPTSDLSFYSSQVYDSSQMNNLIIYPANSTTPLKTMVQTVVKGIYSQDSVVVNNRGGVDAKDYLTGDPGNYTYQRSAPIQLFKFPFVYYSGESSPQGCWLYHSIDSPSEWKWHYQVCGSDTIMQWPDEYLQHAEKSSSSFYRNALLIADDQNIGFTLDEKMLLEHVAPGNMHYGVIRSHTNQSELGYIYQVDVSDGKMPE